MEKEIKAINERLAELYASVTIIDRKIDLAKNDLSSEIREPAIYNCMKKLYLERVKAQDEIHKLLRQKNQIF